MNVPTALFERDASLEFGHVLRPTTLTRGPWDHGFLHGGAVCGAAGWALEQARPDDDLVLARATVEIRSMVPLEPLHTNGALVKPGRRTRVIEATLATDAGVVVRATSQWVAHRPSELPRHRRPVANRVPPVPGAGGVLEPRIIHPPVDRGPATRRDRRRRFRSWRVPLRSWTGAAADEGTPSVSVGRSVGPSVPPSDGHVGDVGLMGGADCEALGGGWLAQPVATWTSVAYAVAGAWFARSTVCRGGGRAWAAAVAAALVAVGVGSFAYHGPQPAWAQAVHDQSITVFVAVMLAGVAWRLRATARACGALLGASGAAALSLVLVGRAKAVPVALGAAVVVGAFAERPQAQWVAAARRWAAPGGVLALAGLVHFAGRTASPLCTPGSWVQLHGLWHVLSAAALALAADRVLVVGLPPFGDRAGRLSADDLAA